MGCNEGAISRNDGEARGQGIGNRPDCSSCVHGGRRSVNQNCCMALPDAQTAACKLLDYCVRNDWAGYDPYDALNSRYFDVLPWLNRRLPRLVMTQLLKRSPW